MIGGPLWIHRGYISDGSRISLGCRLYFQGSPRKINESGWILGRNKSSAAGLIFCMLLIYKAFFMPPPFEDWRRALCFAQVRPYIRMYVHPSSYATTPTPLEIHETFSTCLCSCARRLGFLL